MFEYKKLNQKGTDDCKMVAWHFENLLDKLKDLSDEGDGKREFALTITKLQEASFWAKKSISLNPKNQANGE